MKVIQIGANSGKDDVYSFISRNVNEIELAVLVEPIPYVLEELKAQYANVPNTFIEPIAIVASEETTLTLYYERNSINYEVCSFSKQHLLGHGCPEEKIDAIEVPAMTVNSLMDKYGLVELDYLYIDTEGLDVFIIASLDFKKYKFKNIVFESAHTDGVRTQGNNYQETVDYLVSLGYDVKRINELNSQATLRENYL